MRLKICFVLTVNDAQVMREVEFDFDRKRHLSTLDAALSKLSQEMAGQDYEVESYMWLTEAQE